MDSCGRGTYRGQRTSGYQQAPKVSVSLATPLPIPRSTYPSDADDRMVRHIVGDQGSVEESKYLGLLWWFIRWGWWVLRGWRIRGVVWWENAVACQRSQQGSRCSTPKSSKRPFKVSHKMRLTGISLREIHLSKKVRYDIFTGLQDYHISEVTWRAIWGTLFTYLSCNPTIWL